MKSLNIAPNLKLPPEASTETFAILGRRGSGKTHTAIVMAEEMLSVGIQVVIIDPLDVWFGLRVSKDGKSAGFPIYVCGGSHQDIPLPADGGKVLADAIVDKDLSMVLSVRHLSKNEQRRFVGDFCERLYDRKADPKHRTALHLFIDEADAFVPQRIMPGAERCYGAVDTLVRRGRSSGLAPTLISQRPQVIAKDVLSQTEVLVSHQLTGPQDRKALEAWIEANDTEDKRGEFMASLASLPKGTAWFWSPGMLGIFKRVEVRDRTTFDSSATPKAGVRAVASPKAFAAVDIAALTAELSATIEKAKADDPRELRATILRLEKALHAAKSAKPEAVKPEIQKVPALSDKDAERMEKLRAELTPILTRMVKELDYVSGQCSLVIKHNNQVDASRAMKVHIPPRHDMSRPSRDAQAGPRGHGTRVTTHSVGDPASTGPLAMVERKFLTALSQQGRPLTRNQVAIFAGYSAKSRHVDNTLAALRAKQYIVGGRDGIEITSAGVTALGDHDPLPTGDGLRQYWLGELDRAASAFLRVICDVYPKSITRDEMAEQAGYSPQSRHVDNMLAQLRSRDLVSGGRDAIRASEELFG